MLPGFTDSHVHFMQWALAQRQLRLEGARNLEEAVARVGGRRGGGAEPGTGCAARAGGRATGIRRSSRRGTTSTP